MRTVIAMFVFAFLFSSGAAAQVKAAHFKELQKCLPATELKGLTRGKPSGNSQTNMGMSTSEATVVYKGIPKDPNAEVSETLPEISVKIADMISMPYAAAAFSMQQQFENENEDGYEKSVMIKGKYNGREEARKGEYKKCTIAFGMLNRFVISVEGSNTDDVALLNKLIDGIAFDVLEKIAAPKE